MPHWGELFTPPKPAGLRWRFRRLRGYRGVADRRGHPPGGDDPRVGLEVAPVVCQPCRPARGSPSHRLHVVGRRERRRRKSIEVGSRRGSRGPASSDGTLDLHGKGSDGAWRERSQLPLDPGCAVRAVGSVRGQGPEGLGRGGGPPAGSPRSDRLRADEDGERSAPRNPRRERDLGRSGRRRAPPRQSVGAVVRHRFS